MTNWSDQLNAIWRNNIWTFYVQHSHRNQNHILEKILLQKKKHRKPKKQLKQQRAKLSAVSSPCPCQMNISWRKTRNAHISFGSRTLTLYSIHCKTFESELFFFSFRIRNFHERKIGEKTQTVAKKENTEYISATQLPGRKFLFRISSHFEHNVIRQVFNRLEIINASNNKSL